MALDAQYLPKGQQFGCDSLEMAGSLFATSHDSSGRFKEAEELVKRMLDNELIATKQALESHNQATIETIVKLPQVYFRRGRCEEAVRLVERCYQGYKSNCTSSSVETADVALSLADCYYELGNNEKAKDLYSSSLKDYESHYHPGNQKIFLAYESVAGVLRTQGEHLSAFELSALAKSSGRKGNFAGQEPSLYVTNRRRRAECQYDRALPLLLRLSPLVRQAAGRIVQIRLICSYISGFCTGLWEELKRLRRC
jgi:tetratricopeptide (TPR) repeat protein